MGKKYDKMLSRAAALCAKGEKCSNDIRKKLEEWKTEEEMIERILQTLQDQQFIDDDRFSRFYVTDKLKFNKWGRIKIVYSLRQKQVDESIIDQVIGEIDPGEYQQILEGVLRAKIKSVGDPEKYENRAKLMRFAAQKGFSSEEIFSVLDKIRASE